jgi:CRP-like cAMP-binding protein
VTRNFLTWLKERFIKAALYSDLRGISLFENLNDHDLKLVYDYLHKREFKAGEIIFEEEFPQEVIYFIAQGEVQLDGLFFGDKSRILKENQFIGLIDIFGKGRRLSSARALTNVRLLALQESDFWDLVQKKPSLGVKLLKACCQELGNFIIDTVKEKR